MVVTYSADYLKVKPFVGARMNTFYYKLHATYLFSEKTSADIESVVRITDCRLAQMIPQGTVPD